MRGHGVVAAMMSPMGALQHPHDVAMVSRFRLEVLAGPDPDGQSLSPAVRGALQFPPARWLALVRLLESPATPATEREALLRRARQFEEGWVRQARADGMDLDGMQFRWPHA